MIAIRPETELVRALKIWNRCLTRTESRSAAS
jgi:hypothetical protein